MEHVEMLLGAAIATLSWLTDKPIEQIAVLLVGFAQEECDEQVTLGDEAEYFLGVGNVEAPLAQ